MAKLTTFSPSAQRVLEVLGTLAVDGVVISVPHAEIAQRIGAHEITVTKCMTFLEDSGRIRVQRERGRRSYVLV